MKERVRILYDLANNEHSGSWTAAVEVEARGDYVYLTRGQDKFYLDAVERRELLTLLARLQPEPETTA